MCGDCDRPMDDVVSNKPGCDCTGCMVPGSVIAVQQPPSSPIQGLGPWCIACHHFILVSGN